jgi:hypothetical protein
LYLLGYTSEIKSALGAFSLSEPMSRSTPLAPARRGVTRKEQLGCRESFFPSVVQKQRDPTTPEDVQTEEKLLYLFVQDDFNAAVIRSLVPHSLDVHSIGICLRCSAFIPTTDRGQGGPETKHGLTNPEDQSEVSA